MDIDIVAAARELRNLGWQVFPTRAHEKFPRVSWQLYQKKPVPEQVFENWVRDKLFDGIWVLCGQTSLLLVLDCDCAEAVDYWHKIIGPQMDGTLQAKTHKGVHYFFSLEPDQVIQSWVHDENGVHWFDVQAEGKGVKVAPSFFVDDANKVALAERYEWLQSPNPEVIFPVPPQLFKDELASRRAAKQSKSGSNKSKESTFAEHIANAPTGETGRNNWLTAYAGFLLAGRVKDYDEYMALVSNANKSLAFPLSDGDEVWKLIQSIWDAELRNHGGPGAITAKTGFLLGTGSELYTPDGRNPNRLWAKFDIKPIGIASDPVSHIKTWIVEITTNDKRVVTATLPGAVLGSSTELERWLGARGLSLIPHKDNFQTHRMLHAYLHNQNPPELTVVRELGLLDGKSFVTNDGILRGGATELEPFSDVWPVELLRNTAPCHYGFHATQLEAVEAVQEAVTFQDETISAVYLSWICASILKPLFMQLTSLFPFVFIEAISGFGKTDGFFKILQEMHGDKRGDSHYTRPVLRDNASAHKGMVVWIDDMEISEEFRTLLRIAATGGNSEKMAPGNTEHIRVHFVSPVMISAESFSARVENQAMIERAIHLEPPDAQGRKSLHDPSKSQLVDLQALRRKYDGDFTNLAGWFVSLVLEQIDMVTEKAFNEVNTGGRVGGAQAVIRLGARIAAKAFDLPKCIELVDNWTQQHAPIPGVVQNSLSLSILPKILVADGMPTMSHNGQVAYIEENDKVWVGSPKRISERFLGLFKFMPSSREVEMASWRHIRNELVALKPIQEGVRKDVGKEKGQRLIDRFSLLSPEMSKFVITQCEVAVDLPKLNENARAQLDFQGPENVS